MDFKKIAREILANVGNEENIKDVIHCHTRLRFSLIDSDKVNKDNLSKMFLIMKFKKMKKQKEIHLTKH